MYFNTFLVFAIVENHYFQLSLGDTYNVAIMELSRNPNHSQSTDEILLENTRNYIRLIEETSANQSEALDLIIFPESTLMSYSVSSDAAAQLPTSSDIALCNSEDDRYMMFLKNLSCAAVRYNVTIVINLTEKEICENCDGSCPETGEIFYNTNIALSSNGTVIARYRKWNLFGEYGKSRPTTLDLPVIQIKNTTFGMMTCFDIQFGTPGFNLTRDKAVQNIIFPLDWISELPFLTALQVEQMWAQEFNVVLLASGVSFPASGAGGSGIYFGIQGPLVSDILSESGTKVMVQAVPTNIQQQMNISTEGSSVEAIDSLAASMDSFHLLVDPSIREHNSVAIDTTVDGVNTTVCHGEGLDVLCCDFNISFSVNHDVSKESDSYTYHLVAFNGVRTYMDFYYGGVETCGVVACLNSSVVSCGQRFKNYSRIAWPLTFDAIKVRGNFTVSDNRIQYPTTLLSSIRPLPVREYAWGREEDDAIVSRILTLRESQNRLLTFGIFGRDFERDWDPITNNTIVNNFSTKTYFFSACLLFSISYFFRNVLINISELS